MQYTRCLGNSHIGKANMLEHNNANVTREMIKLSNYQSDNLSSWSLSCSCTGLIDTGLIHKHGKLVSNSKNQLEQIAK